MHRRLDLIVRTVLATFLPCGVNPPEVCAALPGAKGPLIFTRAGGGQPRARMGAPEPGSSLGDIDMNPAP